MKNKIVIFLAGVLVSLILMQGVYALGINPGRTTIDFSPNLEKEIEFLVVNTENKNMNIVFSVDGELSEYINVSNEVVSFGSEDDSKNFKYTLKLPRGLSAGLHTADVIALELPPNGDNEEVVIKATVSVVTQVYVFVPYPGKYIDADLDIVESDNTNEINFYIPFISRGEKQIDSVNAIIDIYKGEVKIESLNTNELSVSAGQRKELFVVWNHEVAFGEYNAIARIDYDGEKLELKKKFNIGGEDLGVLGISVNNFKLGDVAKIKLLVQNTLSDSIKSAFVNMEVYDSDFNSIVKLKSEHYEIPSLSNKEMVLYWDTENLEKGIYRSELEINYDKKFVDRKFSIDVDENSMSFVGIGFVVASGDEGRLNVSSLLYIAIGLLFLFNLAWIIWWIRHKKKK